MKKRNTTRHIFLFILWLSLMSLACNLSATQGPPTIVPRGGAPLAASPQPTLGYAPQNPGDQPEATYIAQQEKIEFEMLNLMNQVEADRLMLHIDTLVSFHTRHVNSPTTSLDRGVGAAFYYIMGQLQAIQAQAPQNFTIFPEGHSFQAQFNGITSTQRNAIAVLQGTDAGAGIIVIGAHYDSRTDDLTDAEAFAPGAVDNGSGVAALIELARILSREPLRATIIFAFFAAEEVGRQGSIAFVRDYIKRLDEPNIIMINLDTIGNWNDARGNINDREIRVYSIGPNDSKSRQLARSTHFLDYNYGLSLNIKMMDGLDRQGRYGDQESFVEAGYPAVRFIEALEDHSKREGRDTIDGVNPVYLVKATRTVLGVVLGMAGGPRAPRSIVLRDAGNGQAALIWEPTNGSESYIVALRRRNSMEINTQFVVTETRTAAWDRWWDFEAVAVAGVDARGLIGPLSEEYKIPNR